ncbi:MAG: hypothetical protein Q3983_07555 [Capnocytophaga sp.]|nr:hypothetical protein [Capnocytophaga sp.]
MFSIKEKIEIKKFLSEEIDKIEINDKNIQEVKRKYKKAIVDQITEIILYFSAIIITYLFLIKDIYNVNNLLIKAYGNTFLYLVKIIEILLIPMTLIVILSQGLCMYGIFKCKSKIKKYYASKLKK